MTGRYERKKPKKAKKSGWKIALIVLAVIVLLLAAVAGAGYLYYNSILNKINRAELIEKDPSQELLNEIGPVATDSETEWTMPPDTEPTETTVPETMPPMKPEDIINILVIGQSARPGEEARMADSTMLITINKYTKQVYRHSVLRDAFVKYPAYKGGPGGRCKFASAYALAYSKWHTLGAFEVMDLLMKENFGVDVDYFFEVDFDMFLNFIDTLGTVELELTQEEADYMNKELGDYWVMEPGWNSMDGFLALTYARMRKAEGDNESDIKRTARQRYLVERILAKVMYKFDNEGFSAVQDLVDATLPYVTTNMENSEINKLILDLIPILLDLKLDEGGTLPVKGTSKGEMFDIYGDGVLHSILRFDAGQNIKLMQPITEGDFGQ